MYSAKDLERLWFLYKTEGEPKGVFINSFCVSNNVPYTVFYDWYKKIQKKAVPVEVSVFQLTQNMKNLVRQRTYIKLC